MPKTDAPTHVLLPVELAAAIVRYLAIQPYGEVAQLIGAIQTLEPYAVEEAKADD